MMYYILEIIFSRDNLPGKIKDGAYIINPDKYAEVGTHLQMLADVGLLYFVTEVELFILIVLVLKMFLKRLNNLLETKT